MGDLLLKNGKIFLKDITEEDILVRDGKIALIGKGLKASRKMDCKGKLILPGIIDPHVHMRCPGLEKKEDWYTGSRAAAHGGITTVLDMPNTSPPLVSIEALKEKEALVEGDSIVNYGFHFGAAKNNIGEIKSACSIRTVKVFMGSSTGSLLVEDDSTLKKVFSAAKERNLLVLVHAEDEEMIKENTVKAKEMGLSDALYHSLVRSNECAEKAVERAIAITRAAGNKLYVCHISTRREVELIKEAKKEGLEVYAEVTPHHLLLSNKDVKALKNYGKMNPPLRSFLDQKALWAAVREGIIDCIGTDHAPHLREEKDKPYWDAPSGVPGLETMLPLMLNAVSEGELSLKRLVELTSINPARIFGLKGKGRIAEGMDADLTIVDPEKKVTVRGTGLYTKCGWTPFEGKKVKGVVESTIIKGKVVYDRKNKFAENKGENVFRRE